jgi:hypothetical protein
VGNYDSRVAQSFPIKGPVPEIKREFKPSDQNEVMQVVSELLNKGIMSMLTNDKGVWTIQPISCSGSCIEAKRSAHVDSRGSSLSVASTCQCDRHEHVKPVKESVQTNELYKQASNARRTGPPRQDRRDDQGDGPSNDPPFPRDDQDGPSRRDDGPDGDYFTSSSRSRGHNTPSHRGQAGYYQRRADTPMELCCEKNNQPITVQRDSYTSSEVLMLSANQSVQMSPQAESDDFAPSPCSISHESQETVVRASSTTPLQNQATRFGSRRDSCHTSEAGSDESTMTLDDPLPRFQPADLQPGLIYDERTQQDATIEQALEAHEPMRIVDKITEAIRSSLCMHEPIENVVAVLDAITPECFFDNEFTTYDVRELVRMSPSTLSNLFKEWALHKTTKTLSLVHRDEHPLLQESCAIDWRLEQRIQYDLNDLDDYINECIVNGFSAEYIQKVYLAANDFPSFIDIFDHELLPVINLSVSWQEEYKARQLKAAAKLEECVKAEAVEQQAGAEGQVARTQRKRKSNLLIASPAPIAPPTSTPKLEMNVHKMVKSISLEMNVTRARPRTLGHLPRVVQAAPPFRRRALLERDV